MKAYLKIYFVWNLLIKTASNSQCQWPVEEECLKYATEKELFTLVSVKRYDLLATIYIT